MPARRIARTYRTPQLDHARVLAAQRELTAQREAAAQREPAAREEPMRRWPHPIPMAGAGAPSAPARTPESETAPTATQVLEQLQCQSQLLVDLLGAVNSLTAAVLVKAGPAAKN